MAEENNDEVKKEIENPSDKRIDTLENKFVEFADQVVSWAESNKQFQNDIANKVVNPAGQLINQKQTDFSDSFKTEMEDLGFDEKQVGFINKMVHKVVNDVTENKLSSYDKNKSTSTLINEYDSKAYDLFPELKNKNTSLYRMTDAIMKQTRSFDSDADTRPKFLYNSVLEAKTMLDAQESRKGNTTMQVNFEKSNTSRYPYMEYHLEGGSLSGGNSNFQKKEEVSQERLQIRKLLGG